MKNLKDYGKRIFIGYSYGSLGVCYIQNVVSRSDSVRNSSDTLVNGALDDDLKQGVDRDFNRIFARDC